MRGARSNGVAHGLARTPARGVARTPAHGPSLPRDRAILVRLAKLRLLSLPQLASLVFPGRHRTRLSYRLSALARNGWLRVWEDGSVRGGRPRYVVPTQGGLRWALTQLQRSQAPFRHATLLATMLRSDRRRPIPLRDGVTPAFLAHQREVNDLLVAIGSAPDLRVTWASSWHRPLPNARDGIRLPQPDFVLVLAEGETRRLVFGEHDRGQESLAHFAEAKATRYRELARRTDLLRALTGFESFSVLVTVDDARGEDSASRLAHLLRVTLERYAAALFTFAPAIDVLRSPARFLQPA